MKKFFLLPLCLLAAIPLAACRGAYDYSVHVSEKKSDIFCAETEEFALTVSCVSREYPYRTDGVACPMTDLVEISLTPAVRGTATYTVKMGGIGGEMSARNAYGDYFYSESVDAFPEGSVSVTVEWDGETREITATSVKNERTISAEDALDFAVNAEKETIEGMMKGGAFQGEFYVRLLRRDKNYYYVGIVNRDGETISLLLDSESGALLARHA